MKIRNILLPPFLLALAASLAFAADADIPQRKRKSPEAIRIVSANIRFPLDADNGSGNEWDKRKELARDVLLAQDADIICFQEFRHAHHAFLKDYFRDYDAAGFVDADDGRKPNTIFFSKKRFEKISEDGAFLSATPQAYRSKFSESASVRHFFRVRLKDRMTGRELIIWNTHLDHKHQPGRDKQAATLVDFIKKQPAGIPQLITGDFNCHTLTPAIKTIKDAAFTDTYTAVHSVPDDPGYTYHNFLGAKYPRPGNRKIDFIFCNNGLRPTAAEIIRDSRDGRYPSDHYFVSAELEYAAAQPKMLP